MRKIISKHEENRRNRKNRLIMGFVLIFGMFFSVVGFSFGGFSGGHLFGRGTTTNDNSNRVNYNGFEFVNQNGLWVSNIGGFNFVFRYNPNQVEKSYSQIKPIDNYYQKPLYIYSENPDAETEIYVNLGQVVLRTQTACLEGLECKNENLPIKTCEDNFIIIKEDNTTGIIQEENCVFITGISYNLIRSTDEFLFKVFGIR